MNQEHKPFAIIIQPSNADILLFVTQLTDQYLDLINYNIVVDLSAQKAISLHDITLFANLSKAHKKQKKSFVIVVNDINFNKIASKMTVVPTLQEAQDIIEIEEIERDLGI